MSAEHAGQSCNHILIYPTQKNRDKIPKSKNWQKKLPHNFTVSLEEKLEVKKNKIQSFSLVFKVLYLVTSTNSDCTCLPTDGTQHCLALFLRQICWQQISLYFELLDYTTWTKKGHYLPQQKNQHLLNDPRIPSWPQYGCHLQGQTPILYALIHLGQDRPPSEQAPTLFALSTSFST